MCAFFFFLHLRPEGVLFKVISVIEALVNIFNIYIGEYYKLILKLNVIKKV